MRGWNVHATDLSPPALARALQEAESFGVEMKGEVADLRRLDDVVKERFAVVISCDNALSHLFDDNDLLAAARQIHGRLLPGGAFLASIRDYDRLYSDAEARVSSTGQQLPGEYSNARGGLPGATLPRVFDDGRRIVFQVWDWSDDRRSYAVHQFIVRRIGEQWETAHHEGRFRALRQRELSAALEAAGFHDISWLAPEQSGYYQPIVTAKR